MQLNSKEALERLIKYANINETVLITKYGYSALNDIDIIKQDLDRLEKLEKVVEILKNILEIQIGVRVDERKILIVSIIEVGEWFAIDINEEQYELLKEVLGE